MLFLPTVPGFLILCVCYFASLALVWRTKVIARNGKLASLERGSLVYSPPLSIRVLRAFGWLVLISTTLVSARLLDPFWGQ